MDQFWITFWMVVLVASFVVAIGVASNMKHQRDIAQNDVKWAVREADNQSAMRAESARTNAALRIENSRLRRKLGEVSSEDDVFPARQQPKTNFKMVGGPYEDGGIDRRPAE